MADRPGRPRPAATRPPVMSHPAARRRGRLLVPGVVLLVGVVIVLVVILVGNFAQRVGNFA